MAMYHSDPNINLQAGQQQQINRLVSLSTPASSKRDTGVLVSKATADADKSRNMRMLAGEVGHDATLDVRMRDGRHVWTTTMPYYRAQNMAAVYQSQGYKALVYPTPSTTLKRGASRVDRLSARIAGSRRHSRIHPGNIAGYENAKSTHLEVLGTGYHNSKLWKRRMTIKNPYTVEESGRMLGAAPSRQVIKTFGKTASETGMSSVSKMADMIKTIGRFG